MQTRFTAFAFIMDNIYFPSLETSSDNQTASKQCIIKQERSDKELIHSDEGQPVAPEPSEVKTVEPDQTESDESSSKNVDKYGYGDATPVNNNIYGYDGAEPGGERKEITYEYDSTRVPRRSSLKGSNGQMPRRASMGCTTTVEVRVRGSRFPVQRRRSIEFNKTVEVKEVTPVPSMTDTSKVWLQPVDFAEMKQERRTLVHKVRRGEVLEEEVDIRGLEKYVDKSSRRAKNMAWDTVLLEQDEQELSGFYNEQRIADLYKDVASPFKAAELAREDEAAVQEYLMSPRTTKLMMRRLSC